ncbi:MAG: hypothetical protein BWX45_01046 [Deltaproteobacteria bacterium ADurb.Bin002]|nr:MAG: hypothetical protein BWX45_01046 [Deltaproteobacteria bacterium ADurb.Bin002]
MSIITREVKFLLLFLALAMLFISLVFGPDALKWLGPFLWRVP